MFASLTPKKCVVTTHLTAFLVLSTSFPRAASALTVDVSLNCFPPRTEPPFALVHSEFSQGLAWNYEANYACFSGVHFCIITQLFTNQFYHKPAYKLHCDFWPVQRASFGSFRVVCRMVCRREIFQEASLGRHHRPWSVLSVNNL